MQGIRGTNESIRTPSSSSDHFHGGHSAEPAKTCFLCSTLPRLARDRRFGVSQLNHWTALPRRDRLPSLERRREPAHVTYDGGRTVARAMLPAFMPAPDTTQVCKSVTFSARITIDADKVSLHFIQPVRRRRTK